MNLSNLLKFLGISIFLSLKAAAAEDEEVATPAEVASLNSSRLVLEAQFTVRLDAQTEKWIEINLDPLLEEHMALHLRPQPRELLGAGAADTPRAPADQGSFSQ